MIKNARYEPNICSERVCGHVTNSVVKPCFKECKILKYLIVYDDLLSTNNEDIAKISKIIELKKIIQND